jgi:hypothetical protein
MCFGSWDQIETVSFELHLTLLLWLCFVCHLGAQVDWIPFDAPCNEQIEAAYQSGAERGQHAQELR